MIIPLYIIISIMCILWSCLIEYVFGEIKEIFHFRRLAHHGLEKVRLIWQLVCIGYNFRKMARLAYG
jgi:hypothetical protein